MQIRLQLIYESHDDDDDDDDCDDCDDVNHEGSSNTKRRVGNHDDTANARLVAHITLDGLDIVIENNKNNSSNINTSHDDETNPLRRAPTNKAEKDIKTASAATTTKTSTPSRLTFPLRSYMQAAIDSLKLSLDIHDLSICIYSHEHATGIDDIHTDTDAGADAGADAATGDTSNTANSFIQINVDSLSYNECRQDSQGNSPTSNKHGSKNIYQKKLELDTVTILVGRSQPWMEQQEIFRMDGIIAIRHGNTHQHTAKKYGNLQSPQGRNRAKQKEQQEHILEIMIQPEIQVGVSFRSLQRILDVVHSYSMEKSSSAEIGGTTIHSSSGATTTGTGGDAHVHVHVHAQEEEDEIGLLAKIIQRQGDEECQYMDHLSKKKRSARTDNGTGADGVMVDMDMDMDNGGMGKDEIDIRRQRQRVDEVQDFLYSDEEEDEDLLHYRNALEASININSSVTGEGKGKDMGTGVMRVRFYMKFVTMQLHLTDTSTRMGDRMETESDGCEDEYDYTDSKESISFTIEELDVSLASSSMHQYVSLDVGDFYIDHLVSCGDGESQESMPILQCYKECLNGKGGRDDEQDKDGGNFALSLTIDIEQNVGAASASRTNCNLTIHPLQMLYLDSVMNKMAMGFAGIAAKGQCKGRGHGKIDMYSEALPKSPDFNCSVICGGILAIAPLHYANDRQPMEETLHNIFLRSGYHISPLVNKLGPALTCEVSCLSILADGASFLDECEKDQEEMQVTASVQSCIVSCVCPLRIPESNDKNSYDESACKFDIVALESEDKIDPDAVVKICYARTALSGRTEAYKKQRAKVQFPAVTPLASVKASQQCDYTEQKGQSDNHTKFDTRKAGLRKGSDPQVAMLKATAECEHRIEIHIPSLVFDLSASEKDRLAAILKSSSLSRKEFSNAHSKDQDSAEKLASSSSVNIVVHCDQCSFSIHQANDTNPIIEDPTLCYILICDGFKSHFLVGSAGLENMRLLFHDITLYEGKDVVAERICISLFLRLLSIFLV